MLDALAAAIKVRPFSPFQLPTSKRISINTRVFLFLQAALTNTAIPKVQVSANASSDAQAQPEVDVSDEEFLQFDTSGVPVIITLTKARHSYIPVLRSYSYY